MNKEAQVNSEIEKKQKKINELTQEIANKEIENSDRYDKLNEAKKEMERMNKEKIQQMESSHDLEMARRKADYEDKMEADH
jgi:hypothetical protein